MREYLTENAGNIIVVIILMILLFLAIRALLKGKGRCSSCRLSGSCPFAKMKETK